MTGLVPFNRKPYNLINTGFNDFQNMLDDFFVDGWPARRSLIGDTFKVDVQEHDKEYIVEAELPGITKEQISLEVEEGKLRISVKKEEQIEEKEKNYIHRERHFSSMQRNIFLAEASSEGTSAKLEDGVLNIIIPKKEKTNTSTNINIE